MLTVGATDHVEESLRRSDLRRRYQQLEAGTALLDPAPLAAVERAVDDGLRAQRQLWEHGSYRELGTILVWLSELWPRRSTLVWRTLIYQEGNALSVSLAAELEATLDWVADRMPAVIRVPEWLEPVRQAEDRRESLHRGRTSAAQRLREERDEHIRFQRFELGMPVGLIARTNAVSERWVWKILEEPVASQGTAA